MNTPAYEIVKVTNDSPDRLKIYEQCLQVRIDVFVHEQKFPLETEVDEYEAFAIHFLLRLLPCQTPIGTIRMYKPSGGTYYKLTRLAVLKEYRKHHLGAALVQRAHQFAVHDHGQAGPTEVIAHSQIPVKPFYTRLGYMAEGDEFDEDGAPHQRMKVRLQPGLVP